MLIPKTMGKMSPRHIRGLHSSPFHHRPRGLGKKSGFLGQAIASEGASPKSWQPLCGVGPAGPQRSKIEVWEPPPRFQSLYGNAFMSKQSLL